ADEEAGRDADLVGDDHRHEGRDHVQRAVRHVDDAEGSEDEREAGGDDEKVGGQREAAYSEQQELTGVHPEPLTGPHLYQRFFFWFVATSSLGRARSWRSWDRRPSHTCRPASPASGSCSS